MPTCGSRRGQRRATLAKVGRGFWCPETYLAPRVMWPVMHGQHIHTENCPVEDKPREAFGLRMSDLDLDRVELGV